MRHSCPTILYVPPILQQIQVSVDQPYADPAARCCSINGTHSIWVASWNFTRLFNTILYENEFQNSQIFQHTIRLFPEQTTLDCVLLKNFLRKSNYFFSRIFREIIFEKFEKTDFCIPSDHATLK
jgi:hypothetical protein